MAGSFLVLVAWIGGRQALDGQITVGELVAAIGLTQFLLGPLGRLALTGEVLAQARSASERIDRAMGAPAAVRGGTPMPDGHELAGALTIEGLRHAGRIVEQGTPDELLVAEGPYAALWAAWSVAR